MRPEANAQTVLPELGHGEGSWVVYKKSDGITPHFECRKRESAEAALAFGHKVVTIGTHLRSLNARIERATY